MIMMVAETSTPKHYKTENPKAGEAIDIFKSMVITLTPNLVLPCAVIQI